MFPVRKRVGWHTMVTHVLILRSAKPVLLRAYWNLSPFCSLS